MPFDSSRTRLPRLTVVFARNASALLRSNPGCTPATNSSACDTRSHLGSAATSGMNDTSRISWSRSVHGSRPRTRNSPWYSVNPRTAFSSVVFPAPLGPMSPTIRPSSTRKSTPSSASIAPNAFRRPRASMQAIASALLFFFTFGVFRRCLLIPRSFQQLLRIQPQPANRRVNLRPLFFQEILAFVLQQLFARARIHEHAQPSPALHQLLVHQLLIAFENRERIDAVIRRHRAYRWQRISLFKDAVQYHRHHSV